MQPVLQLVTGLILRGDAGNSLCRAGVDKIAFTGSTATAKKVMAACAETLTPVLLECGGKDAVIVERRRRPRGGRRPAAWGAVIDAGQTCIGIERVYVAEAVYDSSWRG